MGYGILLVVIVLYIVAGALEAVGLLLAFVGFRRTWAEFGTGEELRAVVFRPVARRTTASARWVEQRMRLLLRLPQDATVHAVTAKGTIRLGGQFSARVGYGPLPSIVDDPDGFVAEVHRRIGEVHDKVQGAEESIAREARAREEVVKELRSDLDARAEEIEQLSKTVAVGGLVEQVYGWSFIFAGVALGTLGNVIQAAAATQ